MAKANRYVLPADDRAVRAVAYQRRRQRRAPDFARASYLPYLHSSRTRSRCRAHCVDAPHLSARARTAADRRTASGKLFVVTYDELARKLEAIRHALAEPESPKLMSLYPSYLEANEPGPGYECLVDAADAQVVDAEIWRALLEVGEAMGLGRHDFPHGPAFQRVLDHLPD